MAGSTDNGNSGGKALESRKFWRILGDFRLIGVVVGVLFWLFESAIHVSLLSEKTFVQQITAPEPNELWMRSLVVLMLIGAGFYIQLTLKRIEEYKNSRLGSIQSNIRRYMVGIVIFWTLIIGVSLTWDIFQQYRNAREAAKAGGQTAFDKDLVYRKWVSSHGGVYVPANEKTSPNPYLSHLQHRDVTTTEGKKLTLVNPAYMTRQVHEQAKELYGTRGHITSLKPLRSENGPDQWEEKALKAFEEGTEKLNELVLIDGVKYMRAMRPMFVEESCLGCHGQQGYKVGDVCGGISVSVPMEPYMAITGAYSISLVLGHGLIWLIGVSGISYGSTQLGRELTRRKQVEKELHLHSEVMKNMTEGVYLVGAESGMIIWANPKFEKMFGYDAGEMNGQSASIVNATTEKEPEETAREIMEVLNKTGQWHGEVNNIKKDGTPFWCFTNCSIFNHPEYGRVIVAVHTDITERKQAEAALRKSEERFRLLYERSPLGYQSLDADGNLIEVNPAWLSLLGYEKEDVVGRSFADFLASGFPELFKERFPCFKAAGEACSVPFVMVRKDGSHIDVEIDGKIRYKPDGSFKQTHCVLRNVTYRKQAEEQEKQHEVELAHAARLSTIGEMASGLAHEINQPLCAIASFADASVRMFESKRFKHRDILESMQSVSTQARRAGDIIKNMRAFVRKDPTGSSIIDICEVISDSVNLVRGQIKQKQAKVELEFPDESLMATANRVQIEQVIINLIQNSLDAMEQTDIGGREILISACETDDEMILVSVVDSGKGFGDVNPSQMFDPFFTTKEEGMGIGLSINTSIIEEHGGKLWAESNENGATFKFTIPINGKEES